MVAPGWLPLERGERRSRSERLLRSGALLRCGRYGLRVLAERWRVATAPCHHLRAPRSSPMRSCRGDPPWSPPVGFAWSAEIGACVASGCSAPGICRDADGMACAPLRRGGGWLPPPATISALHADPDAGAEYRDANGYSAGRPSTAVIRSQPHPFSRWHPGQMCPGVLPVPILTSGVPQIMQGIPSCHCSR